MKSGQFARTSKSHLCSKSILRAQCWNPVSSYPFWWHSPGYCSVPSSSPLVRFPSVCSSVILSGSVPSIEEKKSRHRAAQPDRLLYRLRSQRSMEQVLNPRVIFQQLVTCLFPQHIKCKRTNCEFIRGARWFEEQVILCTSDCRCSNGSRRVAPWWFVSEGAPLKHLRSTQCLLSHYNHYRQLHLTQHYQGNQHQLESPGSLKAHSHLQVPTDDFWSGFFFVCFCWSDSISLNRYHFHCHLQKTLIESFNKPVLCDFFFFYYSALIDKWLHSLAVWYVKSWCVAIDAVLLH